MPPPVERLAQQYMIDPESMNFSPTDIAVETIEQFYFTVDPEREVRLARAICCKREEPQQAIIFCRTKRGTDKVYHRLSQAVRQARPAFTATCSRTPATA